MAWNVLVYKLITEVLQCKYVLKACNCALGLCSDIADMLANVECLELHVTIDRNMKCYTFYWCIFLIKR